MLPKSIVLTLIALGGILGGCSRPAAPKTDEQNQGIFEPPARHCVPPASLEKILQEETLSAASWMHPLDRLKWKIVSEFQDKEAGRKESPPVALGKFSFFTRTDSGQRQPR